MQNNNHRFLFLDGLRGIAAIAVVLLHISQRTPTTLFQSAGLAVDLFFCLSGFVIAWSYSNRIDNGMSFGQYLKKRLIRLYPMFLIGLSIGALLFVLRYLSHVNMFPAKDAALAFIVNAFYLPYFIYDPQYIKVGVFPLNLPAWSLFFELFINLVFFWTIKFSTRKIVAISILLAFILAIFVFAGYKSPGWNSTNFVLGFPRVGYSFMMGVLLCRLYGKASSVVKSPWAIVLLLIGLLLMPKFNNWSLYWISITVFVIPWIVWASSHISIPDGRLARTMEYFGWLSYPIYCIHDPMMGLFHYFLPGLTKEYWFIGISVLIIAGAAHVISKYIEEPIRKRLSQVSLSPIPAI